MATPEVVAAACLEAVAVEVLMVAVVTRTTTSVVEVDAVSSSLASVDPTLMEAEVVAATTRRVTGVAEGSGVARGAEVPRGEAMELDRDRGVTKVEVVMAAAGEVTIVEVIMEDEVAMMEGEVAMMGEATEATLSGDTRRMHTVVRIGPGFRFLRLLLPQCGPFLIDDGTHPFALEQAPRLLVTALLPLLTANRLLMGLLAELRALTINLLQPSDLYVGRDTFDFHDR